MPIEQLVETSLHRLTAYLDTTDFKGYDPYDALNSPFLARISMGSRLVRLAFTQGLKRFPFNLRPVLGVRKDYNPKGMGLFLSGYVVLYRLYNSEEKLSKIHKIVALLKDLKTDGYHGACWGYNFDWQSEKMLTPKGTPNIVSTVYVAHGLLDAYALLRDEDLLALARSACDFILKDLLVLHAGETWCLSYTPRSRTKIHNANVLGAALLARVGQLTHEEHLMDAAEKSIKFTAERQRDDGSWPYGESVTGEGIWHQDGQPSEMPQDNADSGFVAYQDSYHTGFVLESMDRYREACGDRSFDVQIQRGLEYYVGHFFLDDGTPKYFDNH